MTKMYVLGVVLGVVVSGELLAAAESYSSDTAAESSAGYSGSASGGELRKLVRTKKRRALSWKSVEKAPAIVCVYMEEESKLEASSGEWEPCLDRYEQAAVSVSEDMSPLIVADAPRRRSVSEPVPKCEALKGAIMVGSISVPLLPLAEQGLDRGGLGLCGHIFSPRSQQEIGDGRGQIVLARAQLRAAMSGGSTQTKRQNPPSPR